MTKQKVWLGVCRQLAAFGMVTVGMVGTVLAEQPSNQITATLKPNTIVGVAFLEIGQGEFTVEVLLVPESGWEIVTDTGSSIALDPSGQTIWTRKSAGPQQHKWEGAGKGDQSWPGVRFVGKLAKGPGEGPPPTFEAAVADIDIDVDTMGRCSDGPNGHWPPDGSLEEDLCEATDLGGMYLPVSQRETFPEQLPAEDKEYKILHLTVRPHFSGATPSPIGKVKFTINGRGVTLYHVPQNDRDPKPRVKTTPPEEDEIPVPNNGFDRKAFAIVTNKDFTEPVSITASFTWDDSIKGGPATATDTVRLVPVKVDFVRIWDSAYPSNRTTRAVDPALQRIQMYEDSARPINPKDLDREPYLVVPAAPSSDVAKLYILCQFSYPEIGERILWKCESRSTGSVINGNFKNRVCELRLPPCSNYTVHKFTDSPDYLIAAGFDWNHNQKLDESEEFPVKFKVSVIGNKEYSYCLSKFGPGCVFAKLFARLYPNAGEALLLFLNAYDPFYRTYSESQMSTIDFDVSPQKCDGSYEQRRGLGCTPTSFTQGSLPLYIWNANTSLARDLLLSEDVIENVIIMAIREAKIQEYYKNNPAILQKEFGISKNNFFISAFRDQDLDNTFHGTTFSGSVIIHTRRGNPPSIFRITLLGCINDLYDHQYDGTDNYVGYASRIQTCYNPNYERTQGRIFRQKVNLSWNLHLQRPVPCTAEETIKKEWIESVRLLILWETLSKVGL